MRRYFLGRSLLTISCGVLLLPMEQVRSLTALDLVKKSISLTFLLRVRIIYTCVVCSYHVRVTNFKRETVR